MYMPPTDIGYIRGTLEALKESVDRVETRATRTEAKVDDISVSLATCQATESQRYLCHARATDYGLRFWTALVAFGSLTVAVVGLYIGWR